MHRNASELQSTSIDVAATRNLIIAELVVRSFKNSAAPVSSVPLLMSEEYPAFYTSARAVGRKRE